MCHLSTAVNESLTHLLDTVHARFGPAQRVVTQRIRSTGPGGSWHVPLSTVFKHFLPTNTDEAAFHMPVATHAGAQMISGHKLKHRQMHDCTHNQAKWDQ